MCRFTFSFANQPSDLKLKYGVSLTHELEVSPTAVTTGTGFSVTFDGTGVVSVEVAEPLLVTVTLSPFGPSTAAGATSMVTLNVTVRVWPWARSPSAQVSFLTLPSVLVGVTAQFVTSTAGGATQVAEPST